MSMIHSQKDDSAEKQLFDLQIEQFRERARILRGAGTKNEEEILLKIEDYVSDTPAKEDTAEEPLMDRPMYVSNPEEYEEIRKAITEVLEETRGLTLDMEKEHDEFSQEIKEQFHQFRNNLQDQLTDTVRSGNEQIVEAVKKASTRQETANVQLENKIHTESVKTYRNMQELIKETTAKQELLDTKIEGVAAKVKLIRVAVALGVINLAGIAAIILMYMGIL